MKLLFCLFCIIVIAFFSCSGENPLEPGGKEETVNITNNRFSPSSLTVSSGTTVVWVNNDDDFHTVDHGSKGQPADPSAFNLTVLAGESSRHTFNSPGTFPYYCIRHSESGTITVTQ